MYGMTVKLTQSNHYLPLSKQPGLQKCMKMISDADTCIESLPGLQSHDNCRLGTNMRPPRVLLSIQELVPTKTTSTAA